MSSLLTHDEKKQCMKRAIELISFKISILILTICCNFSQYFNVVQVRECRLITNRTADTTVALLSCKSSIQQHRQNEHEPPAYKNSDMIKVAESVNLKASDRKRYRLRNTFGSLCS